MDLATNAQVAQWPVELRPTGIAFEPTSTTVWVSNYNDARVSVLDGDGALVETIPVGRGPSGVAIDPGLGRAYIANSLDRSITVIDVTSRDVTTTKEVGFTVVALSADPVQRRLCMVNTLAMSRVHCRDESLKSIGMASSVGDTLAIDTVRHDLYGTDKDAKTLTAANAVTDEETTIPLGHVPSGLAVDPTTRLVYVALPAAQEILVLSPLS